MRAQPFSAVLTAIVAALLCTACGSTEVSVTAPDSPKCQVTVGNTSLSAPANGSVGQIAISTTRDCTWSASSSAAWVALTSATSGQGSASLSYRVDANPQPSSRRGTVDVNGTQVSVVQDAAACTFALSPKTLSVGAEGGSLTVTVTTLTGCAWTAATGEPWVHITAGASGTGNGTVQITVDANSGAERTSHVHIGDQDVTISQAAGNTPAPVPPPAPPVPTPCRFTLSTTSESVPAEGGTDTVQVQTDTGCAWTAMPDASWLTIVDGASGKGAGRVTYSAAANTGAARTGTLTIAGQTVTVMQAAAPAPACSYSISPSSADIGANGGSGSTNVSTSSGCPWTAASNVAWITLTSGTSGTGNGTVAFTVAANTGAARIGTFTAGGQTFTVSQAAAPAPPPPAPCTYAISPTRQDVDSTGGSGSTNVTTTAGCAWTAASNASWITIVGASTGSGNGMVRFSVEANTGSARTGTLTVAGETFTVSQSVAPALPPPPPPCTFSISPTSQSLPSSGGSGSVAVTTDSTCKWSAASTANWITVTAGASGTGNGTVTFTVAANTGNGDQTTQSRTGTITIAGQTFTVTEAGTRR